MIPSGGGRREDTRVWQLARRVARAPGLRGGAAWARATLSFCTSGAYRSAVWLRMFRPGELHQTTTLTWANRYPRIFAASRDYLADRPALNLLSFGCSTGEEVVTLREYFPDARIIGAEINQHALSVCRRRTVDRRIEFIESTPETIAARGPYDAIFCLAVLQRTPDEVEAQGLADLTPLYPFAKFEAQIAEFDRWLADGGLLVLRNTHYAFSDTDVSARYDLLPVPGMRVRSFIQFDRHGKRRDATTSSELFVKRGAC